MTGTLESSRINSREPEAIGTSRGETFRREHKPRSSMKSDYNSQGLLPGTFPPYPERYDWCTLAIISLGPSIHFQCSVPTYIGRYIYTNLGNVTMCFALLQW